MNNLPWKKLFSKKDNRPEGTIGRYYNMNPSVNWSKFIPIENKPIKYLEIGVADGIHVIEISQSYCKHADSKMYCVDPWQDYDEYPEYKGKQDLAWETFNKNISSYNIVDKCLINRGFSQDIVPTFEDNFFDIIFVDGNHETEFVYKDGCMAFEKVKSGGFIVFDDYLSFWSQTMIGIDKFLEEYKDKIKILHKATLFTQVILRKL
jgi:hypothetical protein